MWDMKKKLSEAKAQLSILEQQYDNEGSLQKTGRF